MYRESYQRGLLTIFYSCGSKPLNIWDTYMQDGYITKLLDEDIRSTVLEIGGTNVSTTYMICPRGKAVLGITMPFLVMVVKNLKKYFSFEVTILDDTGTRRRFRVSNFQSTTQILPLCTVMPIALSEGWNQIQFNMSDFCRRAYKKQFVEVQKFKINANIRIRRIYFADRIFPEEQLPTEYKLFIPLKRRPKEGTKDKQTEVAGGPEKENAELNKRDSKLVSATKIIKAASIVKAVSQVQQFEKRSSKETEVVMIKSATKVPEEGDTAEGGPADEPPVAQSEEPAAQAEEPVATSEEPVGESEEPVAEPEEPDAQPEEPGAQPEEQGAQPEEQGAQPEELDALLEEQVLLSKESTGSMTENVQTQTENVTIVDELPTAEKTTNIDHVGFNLEPIPE